MGKQAKPTEIRFPVEIEDGREIVYYDPTEAVEEHASKNRSTKTIGGLEVDDGIALEQDEHGHTEANRSGKVIAIAKRGQEEPFSYLKFSTVLLAVASSTDEAMLHVRGHLKREGFTPKDFVSFDVTTHYYVGPLGNRKECGWSFSFHQKPFRVG